MGSIHVHVRLPSSFPHLERGVDPPNTANLGVLAVRRSMPITDESSCNAWSWQAAVVGALSSGG